MKVLPFRPREKVCSCGAGPLHRSTDKEFENYLRELARAFRSQASVTARKLHDNHPEALMVTAIQGHYGKLEEPAPPNVKEIYRSRRVVVEYLKSLLPNDVILLKCVSCRIRILRSPSDRRED